jgi:hypothetical protein
LLTPEMSVVFEAPGGTETVGKCATDSWRRCARVSRLCSSSSIVTFAGTEMSGGVMAPPAPMMNAAGMRTFVFGAVALLCLGALFFGTSGGRELVVAVVVVGPALTVPVPGPVAVDVDVADVVAAALVLLGLAELVELEDLLDPPQAARTNEAITAAQSARRGIGAL